MKKYILISFFAMFFLSLSVMAQENEQGLYVAPKTLFPYPQAPDTISSFQDRANYVVIRFWDRFDVSKPIQDEVAFEQAFVDYLDFFPHAHKTVVMNSVKDFMNKAQSNKANYMLIGKLAEKNLYSPQAVFASDEAYMLFLETMVNSSALKKKEKEYYKSQMKKISRNAYGALCPELVGVGLDGKKIKLSEHLCDKTTMLFFNDDESTNSMMSRLRLSTNVTFNNLISTGELKIVCIVPKKYTPELASDVKAWADNWVIVMAEDVENIFDLKISPSVYILNEEKKIVEKNLPVEALLR